MVSYQVINKLPLALGLPHHPAIIPMQHCSVRSCITLYLHVNLKVANGKHDLPPFTVVRSCIDWMC
jgi:hypothetical protein